MEWDLKQKEKQKVMKFACYFGEFFHWLVLNVEKESFVMK